MSLNSKDNNIIKYSFIFLLCVVVVVSLLLPYVSEHPDGLEKIAEGLGFIDSAKEVYSESPIPDYNAKGGGGYIGVFIAEIVGIGVTLLLGLGIGHLLKKKTKRSQNAS